MSSSQSSKSCSWVRFFSQRSKSELLSLSNIARKALDKNDLSCHPAISSSSSFGFQTSGFWWVRASMSSTLCTLGSQSLSDVLVVACAKPWGSAITCSKPPDISRPWNSPAGIFLAAHFSFLTFLPSPILPCSLLTAHARTLQRGPGCRAII